MRAIVMRRTGGPDGLVLEGVPAPRPQAGEALVELHARGVDYADTGWDRPQYRQTPLPGIRGGEGAGGGVLGRVASDEKAEAVREAGGEPLRYGGDLADRVLALTGGRGVDVVLDSVGAPTQAASMAALAPFGELVHFGDAGGLPAPVDPE